MFEEVLKFRSLMTDLLRFRARFQRLVITALSFKFHLSTYANFIQANGKPEVLQMGCYGIGISRILAASLEVLSSETELSWPTEIVPYQIMIIAPKGGSKEFAAYDQVMSLYDQLNSRDDFNVRFMSFGRVVDC